MLYLDCAAEDGLRGPAQQQAQQQRCPHYCQPGHFGESTALCGCTEQWNSLIKFSGVAWNRSYTAGRIAVHAARGDLEQAGGAGTPAVPPPRSAAFQPSAAVFYACTRPAVGPTAAGGSAKRRSEVRGPPLTATGAEQCASHAAAHPVQTMRVGGVARVSWRPPAAPRSMRGLLGRATCLQTAGSTCCAALHSGGVANSC